MKRKNKVHLLLKSLQYPKQILIVLSKTLVKIYIIIKTKREPKKILKKFRESNPNKVILTIKVYEKQFPNLQIYKEIKCLLV